MRFSPSTRAVEGATHDGPIRLHLVTTDAVQATRFVSRQLPDRPLLGGRRLIDHRGGYPLAEEGVEDGRRFGADLGVESTPATKYQRAGATGV
jgi:hypothetical protein